MKKSYKEWRKLDPFKDEWVEVEITYEGEPNIKCYGCPRLLATVPGSNSACTEEFCKIMGLAHPEKLM